MGFIIFISDYYIPQLKVLRGPKDNHNPSKVKVKASGWVIPTLIRETFLHGSRKNENPGSWVPQLFGGLCSWQHRHKITSNKMCTCLNFNMVSLPTVCTSSWNAHVQSHSPAFAECVDGRWVGGCVC